MRRGVTKIPPADRQPPVHNTALEMMCLLTNRPGEGQQNLGSLLLFCTLFCTASALALFAAVLIQRRSSERSAFGWLGRCPARRQPSAPDAAVPCGAPGPILRGAVTARPRAQVVPLPAATHRVRGASVALGSEFTRTEPTMLSWKRSW